MPSPHKKNIYSTEMANHFKMRTIMLVMFIEVEMWYFHGACDMKWAFFFSFAKLWISSLFLSRVSINS